MNYKRVQVATAVKKGFLPLFREVSKKQKPIIITRFGKPWVIITPYSFGDIRFQDVKFGKVTWEQFREELVQQGYEAIMKGKVVVRPSDVVGAEKVQVEKERTRLDQAEFLLNAAKYFAGNLYVCEKCGHKMLPIGIKDDEQSLPALPTGETSKSSV